MGFILLAALVIAIVAGATIWVRRTLHKYAQPENRYDVTGAELARELLGLEGMEGVDVEPAEGAIGDHYDPTTRTVRLSAGHYDGRSLAAVTVAAHEVGHAVQHAQSYQPLTLRTRLVGALDASQKLGAAMLFATPLVAAITRSPAPTLLTVFGGLLIMGSSIVVHLLTLPTEFDASFRRALPLLKKHALLHEVDVPHAQRILLAAACTYVAAALISLFNVARWWAVLRR